MVVDVHIVDVEVSKFELMSTLLLLVGFAVTLAGLWFSASGLRVVVSGRIDERKRSASSLRFGIPLLILGLLLLFGAVWLANSSP